MEATFAATQWTQGPSAGLRTTHRPFRALSETKTESSLGIHHLEATSPFTDDFLGPFFGQPRP